MAAATLPPVTAPSSSSLADFLAGCTIAPSVATLRPDYVAVLVAASGLPGGPSDAESDGWLRAAEEDVRRRLSEGTIEERPHVAAWRDAFRAFGAKPQRTRNSLEALLRRAPDGLPRINRLADLYNAVSILHEMPLGGEDLDRYQGPARLMRATGDERFQTVADGLDVVEHPEPGEVVWADDGGITCRRWNWRQCTRTRLIETTTSALFIIDALLPDGPEVATWAADDLEARLRAIAPTASIARRLLVADDRHVRSQP